MKRPTVFVCGHGRCGSSMVMQMLDAGGFPCFGEYPAYEPEEVGMKHGTASTKNESQGRRGESVTHY